MIPRLQAGRRLILLTMFGNLVGAVLTFLYPGAVRCWCRCKSSGGKSAAC